MKVNFSLVAGAAIVTALVWTVAGAARNPTPERIAVVPPAERTGSFLASDARRQVEQTLADFHAAATPEAKCALVRGGRHLLPTVRSFHADRPLTVQLSEISDDLELAEFQNRTFVRGTGTLVGGRPIRFLLEQSRDGWLVDWRYLTASGDMRWREFARQRPESPVEMRVLARSASPGGPPPTAGPFKLHLRHPDEGEFLTASAEQDSTAALLLAEHLSGADTAANREVPLTLELAYSDSAGLAVTRFLHHDWIDADPQRSPLAKRLLSDAR